MITIIYQFKHNVTWHCRINQFFSFPEQLQIWIYVFLVGDHRYTKHFFRYHFQALKCNENIHVLFVCIYIQEIAIKAFKPLPSNHQWIKKTTFYQYLNFYS